MIFRLVKGEIIRVGMIGRLFKMVRGSNTYRATQPSFLETFEHALARDITAALKGARGDSVTAIDLSGIVGVDPSEVAAGCRRGIREVKPPRRNPGLPSRCGGRRFVAIRWQCQSSSEAILRSDFVSAWEEADRRSPAARLPVPLLLEDGPALLGHLPPRLSGARLERLLNTRLMTYHTLIVDPDKAGNSAKAVGRELDRYGILGLLVRREYPSAAALATMGVPPDTSGRARPRAWESVPAAAWELF